MIPIVRLISGPHHAQVIAEGSGVRIRQHLTKTYGPGRWRKMKGTATIESTNGRIIDAEVHWFEAHGIGRVDMKVKVPLREY